MFTLPHSSGSSPPVRGAPFDWLGGVVKAGLIPARAGSTGLYRHSHPASGAHPRPCGEHCTLRLLRLPGRGSSPPVRGAPEDIVKNELTAGLIPARAGST